MRKFHGKLTRGEQTIEVTGGISTQGIGFIDVPQGVTAGEALLELEGGETSQIMIGDGQQWDTVSFKPYF